MTKTGARDSARLGVRRTATEWGVTNAVSHFLCIPGWRAFFPLSFGGLLIACSTVHTRTPEGEAITMNQKDFAIYVEQVFRHHNQVLNDLILKQNQDPYLDSEDDEELRDAEANMIETCSPLDEIVVAEAEHRSLDLSTLMKLADIVPSCEAITRHVEALIPPLPQKDRHPSGSPSKGILQAPVR